MRLALALSIGLSIAATTASARAQQCAGVVSECRTCHEVRGERPVIAGPLPWHVDHAFADLCSQCHGGDATAQSATEAHIGVRSPLSDVDAACGNCHGAETQQLATGYSAFAERARSIPPPPPASARREVVWGNVLTAALAVALGVGGVAYVVRNERRLRAASSRGAT
ncbi:MAG: hypothetical protein U0271_31510 [Polyangiaceae bacterium]